MELPQHWGLDQAPPGTHNKEGVMREYIVEVLGVFTLSLDFDFNSSLGFLLRESYS